MMPRETWTREANREDSEGSVKFPRRTRTLQRSGPWPFIFHSSKDSGHILPMPEGKFNSNQPNYLLKEVSKPHNQAVVWSLFSIRSA